jgi:ATP-dependent Clp protease adaptor protein ClpS
MPEQSTENTKESGSVATAPPKAAEPKAKPKSVTKLTPQHLPKYNVVLLNDDDHTYEYVIEMLLVIFSHPKEKGFQLAKEVDSQGRVIVLTTHKEKAELKQEQIHAYGADWRMERSQGSMSAIIEPTE